MNEALDDCLENIYGKPYLYEVIERDLDISLLVTDKSNLLVRLRQSDHSCWDDIWRDSVLYLWDMGFKSKKLEESYEDLMRKAKYLARLYGD